MPQPERQTQKEDRKVAKKVKINLDSQYPVSTLFQLSTPGLHGIRKDEVKQMLNPPLTHKSCLLSMEELGKMIAG